RSGAEHADSGRDPFDHAARRTRARPPAEWRTSASGPAARPGAAHGGPDAATARRNAVDLPGSHPRRACNGRARDSDGSANRNASSNARPESRRADRGAADHTPTASGRPEPIRAGTTFGHGRPAKSGGPPAATADRNARQRDDVAEFP